MKLLITGDFFVNNPSEIQIDESLIKLFASCDYRIVNFEAPIQSLDYTELPNKSGPRLMQPVETKTLLKKLNVDALTLANNHIMDQGVQGYYKTVSLLNDFHLMGAGTWREAYTIRKISVGGIKLGLINLSEMQFGMLSDKWSQNEESIGCAWINHVCVNRIISEGRHEVDCLIAIVHAGVEMIDIPLPEWRDRYREMIDLGCDAVIAHHPHVVQGYEVYNNKPIVYSLGNFMFSKVEKIKNIEWGIGALALLDISSYKVDISLIGCKFSNNHISLIDKNLWDTKLLALCDKLASKEYIKNIDKICNKLIFNYLNLFAMGGLFSSKILGLKNIARIILHKYNFIHTLNNIQCESHRWCIQRGLKSI